MVAAQLGWQGQEVAGQLVTSFEEKVKLDAENSRKNRLEGLSHTRNRVEWTLRKCTQEETAILRTMTWI